MSNNYRLIVSALLGLCSLTIHAQTAKQQQLSMDDLFRLADAHSTSIKASQLAVSSAQQGIEAAKAQRLPDASASLSGSYLGDGYLWNRSFGDGQSVSMPHWGNNFALQAEQVIYSGGAISSGIAMAELNKQMAELDLKRSRQQVRFLLAGHYLNLTQLHNQAKVIEQNIELTRIVIKNMEARRDQGTALRNDVTRYELQLERLLLQLTKVNDMREIVNHQLVVTLHLPEGTRIMPDTTLTDASITAGTESLWQQTAQEENANVRQSAVGVEISRQQLRLERSEMLPKIAFIAEEHLDGPITIEVPVIDKNFNYWFAGIGVKYNIASLYKSNKRVRQAKLNVRQAEEKLSLAREQTNMEVQAAYTEFLTSYKELQTQQKSVQLAQQNYDVTSNRYNNSLALLTDMLDASNTKIDAELALVNARINVLYHYYHVRYTTHTL